MSLKFGKTIRTLRLSQNYLVLIKESVTVNKYSTGKKYAPVIIYWEINTQPVLK